MAKLVSKTYGEALFELGKENGTLSELEKEAGFLCEELCGNPDFMRILDHPAIGKEEKLGFLENCLKGRCSKELTGLFKVAVKKGRCPFLKEILEYFLERVREYKKAGRAEVVTAMELNAAGREQVEKKLLSTTDYETMEITYRVDESLIAGIVIHMGGKVVDNSVKHRIEELKSRLLKVSLEEEKVGENVP